MSYIRQCNICITYDKTEYMKPLYILLSGSALRAQYMLIYPESHKYIQGWWML